MTSTALITRRKAREHEEDIINDSLRSMENAGGALAKIKDEELWKDDYESFEDYCIKRWKFKAARAYQLISGAAFVGEMKAYVEEQKKPDLKLTQIPLCEGHVRALTSNADGIEEQTKLLAASIKAAGDKPLTRKVIEKAATELYGEKPKAGSGGSSAKATVSEPAKEPEPEVPVEPPSQFNPDELEGTARPPAAGSDTAKRAAIQKQIESIQKRMETALEDMGPLIRALDACHAGPVLHKQVVAHYLRMAGDQTTAIEAMKELVRVWDESGRKKAS